MMKVFIKKLNPLYGIGFIEIFYPCPETPHVYPFNIDGDLYSYRTLANLIFIGGKNIASFNVDMIYIIRLLIKRGKRPSRNS